MAPTAEEQERPFTKQHLFGSLGESVALYVGNGKSEVVLYAHEKLLRNASPFFDAACKKMLVKPEERVIKMPEDDPLVIRVLLHWVYHNKICLPPTVAGGAIGFLLQVFAIADKFFMARMKNDVMDAAVLLRDGGLDGALDGWFVIPDILVNHIYRTTTEDSPFRELMLQIMGKYLDEIGFHDAVGVRDYCSDFLKDIIEMLCANTMGSQYPTSKSGHCSLYHTHADQDDENFKPCEVLKRYIISKED